MIHLDPLIIDLALIMAAGGITSLIFKKLKQPLVLGYILAGLLLGPHVSLFPNITEIKNVEIWSEIGVIFLLFSLGLEFSFKKLMKVGGSASITASVEVLGMAVIGYGVGHLLGWSVMDSIFLGGILSISSTTIIIRAFDELGVKTQNFASLVFGALVVEDLIAIVLLVLLSTVAVSQQFAGIEMLSSIFKLVFFLILWFLAGIFFIPSLLKATRNIMSEETLLIVSLALCLVMVILATEVGFSKELGAFIMGSILAETTQGAKIEHMIKPIKDLFGTVFFVSVGMLIEPKMIAEHIGPVLLITVVTIFGKGSITALGALLSGQSLKTSVQAGLSMAQIGEFSFIIATLGLSLNVISPFLYPIAVAVSALTTFTTPYLIRFGKPTYEWIEAKLPKRWLDAINHYSSGAQTISTTSDWQTIIRSYLSTIVLFSVVIIAIILLSFNYALPFVYEHIKNTDLGLGITAFITLLCMMPFLWALAVRGAFTPSSARIFAENRYKGPLLILYLSRVGLAIFFIIFLLESFFSMQVALVVMGLLACVFIIFRERIGQFYENIEYQFIKNYNDREEGEEEENKVRLAPWDAHMARFVVAQEAPAIGKTLNELSWREKVGINVAMIKRGQILIDVPTRNDMIFPGDELYIIGTDVQLKKMNAILRPAKETIKDSERKADVSLHQFVIRKDSSLFGKSIRESSIRTLTNGLVVGIERDGQRILNPESTLVFEKGDVVWIVGESKRVSVLF